jgi:hypothetical protein
MLYVSAAQAKSQIGSLRLWKAENLGCRNITFGQMYTKIQLKNTKNIAFFTQKSITLDFTMRNHVQKWDTKPIR